MSDGMSKPSSAVRLDLAPDVWNGLCTTVVQHCDPPAASNWLFANDASTNRAELIYWFRGGSKKPRSAVTQKAELRHHRLVGHPQQCRIFDPM
jgi:hypothetical protein